MNIVKQMIEKLIIKHKKLKKIKKYQKKKTYI